MPAEALPAQSDDSYERIVFKPRGGGEAAEGTVGWREGAENRVVFAVWDGPSFAATGKSLDEAYRAARAGIRARGYDPATADLAELLGCKAGEGEPPDLAGGKWRALSPLVEPVLWLALAAILVVVLLPLVARAEIPVPGRTVPFPNAPYAWRYEGPDFNSRIGNPDAAARLRAEGADLDRLTPRIAILDNESGAVVARYALDGGSFCDYEDDNCALDGFFPIVLSGAAGDPVLGAVTHVGVHGQRLSVFRPLQDAEGPVFEATADYALILKMLPWGLAVELERAGKDGAISREYRMWIAGDGPQCREPDGERLPDPPAPSREAAALENDLRRIARDRNLSEFIALMSEDVLVSFGGQGGKQEFLSMLDRGHETDGEAGFWATLDRLLATGGWNRTGGAQSMTWPWFFEAWPDSDDGFDAFIAGPDVPLRAGPHESAPVLAELPFGVLRWAAPDGEAGAVDWRVMGWLPVAAPGHCLGYVRASDAVPLLGTRMVARHDGRRWQIEAFVAGD